MTDCRSWGALLAAAGSIVAAGVIGGCDAGDIEASGAAADAAARAGASGAAAGAGGSAPLPAGASGRSAAGCGGSGPACATPGGRGGAPAPRDAGTPRDSAVRDAEAIEDSGMPDAGGGDPGADRPGWTLSFRDEFNGPEGMGIDTSKWTPVNKGDGFGNNELQFYTNRTQNARMDGEGSLIIEVIEEQYMGRNYTSARLESSGKFEQTYGRFEVRAKLPFGQGIWPAFWLLGNDISSVSWPNCGEIDIMEHVGRTPSTNYGSLHGPGYSGGNPLSARYELQGGARFADDFHVYAVEWERDVVRFYVDDDLYETRTPADVPSGGRWVYDHPFFMLLNVAVGGAFPGSPDDTTVFPQRMLVDYVRVYERAM